MNPCVYAAAIAATVLVFRLPFGRRYQRSYLPLGIALAIAIAGSFLPDLWSMCAFLASLGIALVTAFADRSTNTSFPRPRWKTGLTDSEVATQTYLADQHGLPIEIEQSIEPQNRPGNFQG